MKKPFKIGLIAVFLLGLAGLAVGLYMFNLGQKNLHKIKPDYKITAVDLLKEFANNESAASEKYVDKILEVSGSILQVKTVEGKARSIILDTGNQLSSVICDLAEAINPDDIDASLPISIRGELSGFLMDVLLNNCVIVK